MGLYKSMNNHGSFSESKAVIEYYSDLIIKKHSFMRVPCLVITRMLLSCCDFVLFLISHNLKITSILMALFCFIGSSSFSFAPAYNEASPISSYEINDAVDEKSKLYVEDYVKSSNSSNSDSEEADLIDEDSIVGLTEIQNASEALSTADNSDGMEKPVLSGKGGNENFDHGEWNLILINRLHPIPGNYDFPLSKINGNMYCDKRVFASIMEMFEAADKDGMELVICSPYRSDNHQEYLFNRKINNYMNDGASYMDAYCETAQAVTIPGTSEHQVGLAFDIVSKEYRNLDAGFAGTKEGKWLAENAPEYGFILRYPENKVDSTGIEFEPWHFRYVGVKAAKKITKEKITLEEFWNQYVK